MKHTVYLGLGTNLGEREQNLARALQALAPEVVLQNQSQVYETPPWGFADQPAFFNMVVCAQTSLSPEELLRHVKEIEQQLGRTATFRYGPRLIDVDILFYDQNVVYLENLQIPHPQIPNRAFVLVPLAEIAPGLEHPQLHQTPLELLAALDVSSIHPLGPLSSLLKGNP